MRADYMKTQNNNYLDSCQILSDREIITKPIMDIAARFWEKERYEAFHILYRSFRIIDDFVDNKKIISPEISDIKKQKLIIKVENWVDLIKKSEPKDNFQKELVKKVEKFNIPTWPWKKFSESMVYDINNKGFKTFRIFLNYAEGAVVAPAYIFLHLCGVTKKNGQYFTPKFEIREAAKSAALFAYIVHIFRDFQKDQNSNQNFFAEDLMVKNGVDYSNLKKVPFGDHMPLCVRGLMKDYYDYAEYYRKKTRLMMGKIKNYLQPRYQLSLEIVYNLYLQIFERIDVQKGKFTTLELNPSPSDIKNRIDLIFSNFKPA
jgi:phytoene/squalene synthetase